MQVKYSNQAKKFLKKTDKTIALRILDKVEELLEEPFPKETKRVEGYKEKTFRVRVGDYRILYEVNQKDELRGIIRIDKRERVY